MWTHNRCSCAKFGVLDKKNNRNFQQSFPEIRTPTHNTTNRNRHPSTRNTTNTKASPASTKVKPNTHPNRPSSQLTPTSPSTPERLNSLSTQERLNSLSTTPPQARQLDFCNLRVAAALMASTSVHQLRPRARAKPTRTALTAQSRGRSTPTASITRGSTAKTGRRTRKVRMRQRRGGRTRTPLGRRKDSFIISTIRWESSCPKRDRDQWQSKEVAVKLDDTSIFNVCRIVFRTSTRNR